MNAQYLYLGFTVGILSFFVLLVIYYLSCCRRNSEFNYQSVNHDLDDEEIEFKKTIELQPDDLDDIFSFNGKDDMDFDVQDRDRLSMLERYRNNLVSGADAAVDI